VKEDVKTEVKTEEVTLLKEHEALEALVQKIKEEA